MSSKNLQYNLLYFSWQLQKYSKIEKFLSLILI